jgi:hypothetical protein
MNNAMIELQNDSKKKRTLNPRSDTGMFFSTAGTGCSSITRATILLLYFKLQSEPTKKARRTTE